LNNYHRNRIRAVAAAGAAAVFASPAGRLLAQPQGRPQSPEQGQGEVAPAAPAAQQQPQQRQRVPLEPPLKVGFVHAGSIHEVGWTHQHDLGRIALEKELGSQVECAYMERVPEGQDAERVLRDMVSQGRRLIFSTAFGFMDPTVRVAREFSDFAFENATGYKTLDNVAVYNARFYEGRYLAGLLAGHSSESGVIGYVAAMPIPEVLQGINAFTVAARSVNPKLEVRVIWINGWHDAERERDAALALISQGSDVLTHHTDTAAVAEVAEQKRRLLIGYNSDLREIAPTMHLASVTHHWGRYYIRRAREVLDGSWTSANTWGGLADDFVRLESFARRVPASVRREIRNRGEDIAKGRLLPFSGPLKSNDGKQRVADGFLTDEALHRMDWLVEGIVGKIR
jgi:simple sugar transport system substrate-binding protein